MRTVRAYLVVRGNGEMRVRTRRPALRLDEVCFPLTVQIPESWGKVYEPTTVTLPDDPPAELSVDAALRAEEEGNGE